MSISEKINVDIITAMKAHEEHRLTTLRMVKSALRSKEIDKRQPLSDAEQTQILTTLLKQRRESVVQFQAGNRADLVDKENAEIAVLQAYMPQALGESELDALIAAAIATSGAASIKDMGKVMAALRASHAGTLDMSKAGPLVKARLS